LVGIPVYTEPLKLKKLASPVPEVAGERERERGRVEKNSSDEHTVSLH
jgi:hypothetical protein